MARMFTSSKKMFVALTAPFAYVLIIGSLIKLIDLPPDPNIPFYPFWVFFGFVVIFGSCLVFSVVNQKQEKYRIILVVLYTICIPPLSFLVVTVFSCKVFNDCL